MQALPACVRVRACVCVRVRVCVPFTLSMARKTSCAPATPRAVWSTSTSMNAQNVSFATVPRRADGEGEGEGEEDEDDALPCLFSSVSVSFSFSSAMSSARRTPAARDAWHARAGDSPVCTCVAYGAHRGGRGRGGGLVRRLGWARERASGRVGEHAGGRAGEQRPPDRGGVGKRGE
jgi:hypothetical protein